MTAGFPLITVVIPSYNHAAFVGRAVTSVLEQTYPAVQLVVIDDGSTDGSVAMLEQMARVHEFTFVSQENQGVCRTLNRAIREYSRGEWIALLGSDDYFHHDKLREQMTVLRANPGTCFCYTQALEFFDGQGDQVGRIRPSRVHHGRALNRVFLRQHVPAGTMLFSRKLFDKVGGFDENLHEEDWDFVIRSASITEFCAVDRPLLYYRAHEHNTMRTVGRRRIFQQKARLLSKNMHLVSPWRWLVAILVHFAHDIVFSRLRDSR